MGMVYAPARNDFYWGYQGGGAFCRETTRITPITVRQPYQIVARWPWPAPRI